jgi:glycine/D-amino acid oxidase-like deaminating enzyme
VLTGEAHADACVIGLGGSGLACIDEFLHAGVTVVGLDAGTVGGAAAGRNGGLLRAGSALFHHDACARYGRRRAGRIYAATVAERERVLRQLPSIARRCGYLRLAHDAEEIRDCRVHLSALRSDGFQADWYDGPLGKGLLVRDDAAIDPLARCRMEAVAVTAAGARLFERSEAYRVTRGRVETAEGLVLCRVIVVAVDGALASVVSELDGRVWPVRLQMMASGPHPDVLPYGIGTRRGWDYAQQLPNGVIAFGGCRDVDRHADRARDAVPTPPVQAALDKRFTEVTGLAPSVTHRWAAIVGYTTDQLPVLEEVRPRIWATGGYSGTGNLLGAVCGRAAAQLALGARQNSPLD